MGSSTLLILSEKEKIMGAAYQAQNAHPALYVVPEEDEDTGVFAVMTVMSEAHYGLIVCMRDSEEFQSFEVDDLCARVVQPWAQQIPYLVELYQERFREMVGTFPPLRMDVPFSFEIVGIKNMNLTLRMPEGRMSPDHGPRGETQYLFIAPVGVPFEEFITFGSGSFLN
jgi:hypothetical protein